MKTKKQQWQDEEKQIKFRWFIIVKSKVSSFMFETVHLTPEEGNRFFYQYVHAANKNQPVLN